MPVLRTYFVVRWGRIKRRIFHPVWVVDGTRGDCSGEEDVSGADIKELEYTIRVRRSHILINQYVGAYRFVVEVPEELLSG